MLAFLSPRYDDTLPLSPPFRFSAAISMPLPPPFSSHADAADIFFSLFDVFRQLMLHFMLAAS